MPVYFIVQWSDIINIWPFIVLASVGVLIGTELGVWTLGKISEALFKKIVSGIILFIGILVLIHR